MIKVIQTHAQLLKYNKSFCIFMPEAEERSNKEELGREHPAKVKGESIVPCYVTTIVKGVNPSYYLHVWESKGTGCNFYDVII